MQEAANRLNVSERTIRNYIRQGRLIKAILDGKTCVTLESLESISKEDRKLEGNVSMPPGKIMVDFPYLEALLTRLGALENERKYLIEYKAGIEDKDQELSTVKAKLADLEGVEKELEIFRDRVRELEAELIQAKVRQPWWKFWK